MQSQYLIMAESQMVLSIAIFASGTGSNTQRIIDYFRSSPTAVVALIVSNNPDAGVMAIAKRENIPSLILEKEKFFRGNAYVDEFREKKIDLIVLAGFLWKIPTALIRSWPEKIINLHPALLPAHGGKGMYGLRVHEAVIAAGDLESGITIHFVDPVYDHGKIIFQARCVVENVDTPESLSKKVQELEHRFFPKVIASLVDVQKIVKR